MDDKFVEACFKWQMRILCVLPMLFIVWVPYIMYSHYIRTTEFHDAWVAKHGSTVVIDCMNGVLVRRYPYNGAEQHRIITHGDDDLVVPCGSKKAKERLEYQAFN